MKQKAKTVGVFELNGKYPTEDKARKYFERLRWGKKPTCVRCGHSDRITPQKKPSGQFWCGGCRKYFNAFTNTPIERAKVKPRKWILAAYLLMTSRKGISSLQLSKELSVSQPTAWYILHRLRLACGNRMESLSGVVEVDETYLGGIEQNKHEGKKAGLGRGPVGKQAVIGMRERGGRVKAIPVDKVDGLTLHEAIKANVAPGSTVYTDDHRGYLGLDLEYEHGSVKHSAKEFVNEMAHTNGIESVWAVLKRGYNGVYHNWSRKHTRAYVDEFAFRLNDGNCSIDTEDRLAALFSAMVGNRITFADLTA